MSFYSRSASVFIIIFAFIVPGLLIPIDAASAETGAGAEMVSDPDEARAPQVPEMFDFDLNITYAIISPKQFIDQLLPFAEWKTKKGVPAEIFNLNEIYDTYTGLNKSAKIHKFLRELKKYKPQVQWLLLVGDSEFIPAPVIRADLDGEKVPGEFQDFAYSDYYYAGIDTIWDHDRDGIYGEALEDYDWTANYYVGRLPVSDSDDLDIILHKLDTYEKNPPVDEWYYNVILAGAVMDVNYGPNKADDPDTYKDDGYNDYKDNAKEVKDKVKELLDSNYNFLEYYDYYQLPPGGYSSLGDTLNEGNFMSAFNQGSSLVNIVSHGYDNGNGHIEYAGDGQNVAWQTFFDYRNARDSTNGDRLPLVYSSSCTSGNFTEIDDSGLEQLLTAKNGGAIGFVGATVTTYRGEFSENDTSFGNWWLDENFFKLFSEGDHKIGRVLYRLKELYGEHVQDPGNPHGDEASFRQMFRVNQLAYNYLGDPELSIWTTAPESLMVEFDPVYHPQYWDSPMSVRVRNQATGEVVPDARVTVSGPNQYDRAVTDAAGVAEVPFSAAADASYDLVVTADDHLPYESSFMVEAKMNLELTAGNLSVDKQRLQKGARTNITVRFRNVGTIAASQVELALFDGAPDTDNRLGVIRTFDNVEPGNVRQISIPWTMPGGDHDIHAVLDPYNKLMEYKEDDNTASIMIYENNAPVFYQLPVIPLDEDQVLNDALDLDNYVWDPDFNNVLSYRIIDISESGCRVLLDAGNKLDITPDENWYGACNITLEATDGIETQTAYLDITVRPINDPPELKHIQNQTMIEDDWFELLIFGFDFADAGDTITYETDMLELFPDLVPGDNYRFDNDKGVLKLLTDNSMVGEHVVRFRAVDGNGGASAWQEVTFTIINSPDPLVFNTTNEKYTVSADEKLVIDVQVHDEDVGDKIVFWDDTDLFDINKDSGRIEFKPGSDDVGTHFVTIFASDGNITVEEVLEITVENGSEDTMIYLLVTIIIIVVAVVVILMFASHNRRLSNIKAKAAKTRGASQRSSSPKKVGQRRAHPRTHKDSEEEEE